MFFQALSHYNRFQVDFIQNGRLYYRHPIGYAAGFVAIVFGYFIGQLPLVFVQRSRINALGLSEAEISNYINTHDFAILHIDYNLGLFLMLCAFLGAWMFYLIILNIQKIPLILTLTGRKLFDWRRFWFGFGCWLLLTVIFEFGMYLMHPYNYKFHFNGGSFVWLLLLGITLVPLQAAFEEVFFRGYLLQGIHLGSKSIILSLLATTLLFSLVHSNNPEIEKYGFWSMQAYYLGAGLFLSLLAVGDNGLELPIGIHTATNVFGAVFMKYEGSVLQTDTLFELKLESAWPMTISFYACALIMLWISMKKYGSQGYLSLFEQFKKLN